MRQSEVWFRNPHNYIRELVECNSTLVAWDRGVLVKRRLDPYKFLKLHYGPTSFRTLLVGAQGTAEVDEKHSADKPLALYPTWTYGDPTEDLVSMIENPAGEDRQLCFDESTPIEERPVFGQEHRVVITEIPNASTGMGKKFLAWVRELQEDNPDCIVHLHGLYSLKWAFGSGFAAADMDPRTTAAAKRVILASGQDMDYKKVQSNARWVTALGMSPGDLESPAKRCIFNIRSIELYARQTVKTLNLRLAPLPSELTDIVTPPADYIPPSTKEALPLRIKLKDGDKTVCNACSVQLSCKQFRVGEVCSLPESNTARLANFFKTRDSAKIIDGLGTLMAMGANRLEQKAAEETAMGEVDPEVTKMINALFAQGMQLAKLVDPTLRGTGVKVNVGVINGQASTAVTAGSTPAELTGQVVRALEAQGIPRDKITPELVMSTLNGMANPEAAQHAIEGSVIAQEG